MMIYQGGPYVGFHGNYSIINSRRVAAFCMWNLSLVNYSWPRRAQAPSKADRTSWRQLSFSMVRNCNPHFECKWTMQSHAPELLRMPAAITPLFVINTDDDHKLLPQRGGVITYSSVKFRQRHFSICRWKWIHISTEVYSSVLVKKTLWFLRSDTAAWMKT